MFLDYQNVHLVAHGLFMPHGTPVHDALVHPLRIAERLVAKRTEDSELSSVRVFRGRPNPGHQPIPAAANDAQTAAWEREDPRLRVRWPLVDDYRGVTSSDSTTSMPYVIRRSTFRSPEPGRLGVVRDAGDVLDKRGSFVPGVAPPC